jgi:hypothetical protein
MALTKTVKSTVDFSSAAVAAGIVAYVMFGKTKDYRVILIGAGIAFLLVYIVVSKITKAVIAQGPAQVPTGGGCDTYDPKALIDSIYTDCTCTFCTRDRTLYDTLLGLSDCQIRTAYNYWNANYYSQVNKSLPIMIAAQGNTFDSQFEQQQAGLSAKFSTLNLQ